MFFFAVLLIVLILLLASLLFFAFDLEWEKYKKKRQETKACLLAYEELIKECEEEAKESSRMSARRHGFYVSQ